MSSATGRDLDRRYWVAHGVFWLALGGFGVASLAILKDWGPWTVLLSALLWTLPGCAITSALAARAQVIVGAPRVALAWALASALWYGSAFLIHWAGSGQTHSPRTAWTTLSFQALVVALWGGLTLLARHMLRAERARRRAHGAQLAAKEANLRALRYQLQPHFLFNAINSISAAVGEDREPAQRMLRDLAALLRETLDAGDEGTVADELSRLRHYLGLEKARFEDGLEVNIEADEDTLSEPIPPLLLQPLVENAIRHGMTAEERLTVRVRVTRSDVGGLKITVSNSGALRSSVSSSGVGLASVRDRLAAFAPDASRFDLRAEDGWVHAELDIGAAR